MSVVCCATAAVENNSANNKLIFFISDLMCRAIGIDDFPIFQLVFRQSTADAKPYICP